MSQAPDLVLGRSPLGGAELWSVGTTAASAGPVLVLLDVSGSLLGAPLRRAAAFAAGLLAALPRSRGAALLTSAGELVSPLGPAPRPEVSLPARVARRGGRADFRGAARLARVEVERSCASRGAARPLAGATVVLVSDLAIDSSVAALRELEALGARLVPCLVPSGPAPSAGLEPAVRVGDDAADAVPAALDVLGGAPAGLLRVTLARLPRRWFLADGARLSGGAPASAREVTAPLGAGTLLWLADADATAASRGTATVELAGGPRRATDLAAAGAAAVPDELVAAVRAGTS